jgi:hypothetical protein
MNKRKPHVAKWEKDDAWHFTVRYVPTKQDRLQFPVSYPPGDDGPFFRWHTESYDTREQALNAMREHAFQTAEGD